LSILEVVYDVTSRVHISCLVHVSGGISRVLS